MIDYNTIYDGEAIDYKTYKTLINKLLEENKTTGSDHSEDMLNYTKLNLQRMNRIDKTTLLNPEITVTLEALKNQYRFLVISEGWCGDAAQIVPVINKLAEADHGKIGLKFVLRDQHIELIDAHLTNGGRAIPVLLVLDNAGKVLAQWGPRPQELQDLLIGWRAETTDFTVVAEKLHAWYAKDKTQQIQQGLLQLLKNLN